MGLFNDPYGNRDAFSRACRSVKQDFPEFDFRALDGMSTPEMGGERATFSSLHHYAVDGRGTIRIDTDPQGRIRALFTEITLDEATALLRALWIMRR